MPATAVAKTILVDAKTTTKVPPTVVRTRVNMDDSLNLNLSMVVRTTKVNKVVRVVQVIDLKAKSDMAENTTERDMEVISRADKVDMAAKAVVRVATTVKAKAMKVTADKKVGVLITRATLAEMRIRAMARRDVTNPMEDDHSKAKIPIMVVADRTLLMDEMTSREVMV